MYEFIYFIATFATESLSRNRFANTIQPMSNPSQRKTRVNNVWVTNRTNLWYTFGSEFSRENSELLFSHQKERSKYWKSQDSTVLLVGARANGRRENKEARKGKTSKWVRAAKRFIVRSSRYGSWRNLFMECVWKRNQYQEDLVDMERNACSTFPIFPLSNVEIFSLFSSFFVYWMT